MKKTLCLIVALLALPILVYAAPERIAAGIIIVTASDSGTPVSLTTGTNVWCVRATILGKKAARTANTGEVYIGPASANNAQPFKVVSDGEVVIEAAEGSSINLKDWYLDVTTNDDGVVIIYQAR